MYQAFLIKYGEIGIKGKNRRLFEDALIRNIKTALSRVEGEFEILREQGRVYVEAKSDFDYDSTVEALRKVFGIVEICPACLTQERDFDKLSKEIIEFIDRTYETKDFSFKVFAKRADKKYPMNSMEINMELGGRILDAFPTLSVDVHKPDVELYVEIREVVSYYSESIKGLGGMPVGTNGSAMLLLSGGIDSPVAGYMVAKRGVKIDAVYFHAPPYTSERAKKKVIDLCRIVSEYAGPIRLHIVNFTDTQLEIYEKCPHEQLTIIMRRYMMKIAEAFAEQDGSLGLVTGESIGQVASQTMHSMFVTNEVCKYPVYRPLIGFDKQEIIERALEIGTYETSILPFEDCCTIFVAKHPETKPRLNIIKKNEENLVGTIEELVQTAIDTTETILVQPE
jgi:thiamine biosynthesis protein ThiI